MILSEGDWVWLRTISLSLPVLSNPSDGGAVNVFTPTLTIHNSTDIDRDILTYEFEVYDETMTTLISSVTGVSETPDITSWTVPVNLIENKTYYWRARAYDGDRYGEWMDTATFSIHLPVQNITATIDFDPNTLNQKDNGKWVTVYIELPNGYDVNNIIVSSILLEGTVPAEQRPYCIGDHDKDGIPDPMVKFRRSDMINVLPEGDNVLVHVSGLVGTVAFDGVDMIRVIH